MVMMETKPRLVEYFLSEGALDGSLFDDPHQYDTEQGLLLCFAEQIHFINEQPFQETIAIIEDPETREIKKVRVSLLKHFCE